MSDIQLNVHTYKDKDETEHCYERKIVSGDQKTEKNMHFGILSKTDENSEADCLGYLLPAHEYFHQSMAVADCESELFRDSSRGLDGGAFFLATLLNRKDAKNKPSAQEARKHHSLHRGSNSRRHQKRCIN